MPGKTRKRFFRILTHFFYFSLYFTYERDFFRFRRGSPFPKSSDQIAPPVWICFFSILDSRNLIIEPLRKTPDLSLIDDDSLLVMMNLAHRRDDCRRPTPKCLL